MASPGPKRRLAHALPELVWLNDDLRNRFEGSRHVHRAALAAAMRRRRRLDHVLFVAVTGSSGKSTTKELVASVLGSRFSGTRTPGNFNTPTGIARTILRTSPAHDFSVIELGTKGPGMLRDQVDLVRPRVGIVTTVGLDHIREFESPEAIAREKQVLVEALPVDGVAILNGDEPTVLAMGRSCKARVVTFGLDERAVFTAVDVDSSWPAALSFTVRHEGEAAEVRTSLYGRHWVHPLLAAIAAGVEVGVPLAEAARAVETVRSFGGRMQPVSANGVTFIRDDVKAGLLTALPALDFMKDARAARKIVVFGRITNFEGDPYAAYAALAERALEVADEVIFAGPEACYAPHPENGAGPLRILPSMKAAAEYLRQTTRPGDLVLLKGSRRSHMQRITLAYAGEVRCWLSSCGRKRSCDECKLLDLPSDPDDRLPARLLPARLQPRDPV
jgi:UDP-N-acetylmuramoyl-tripeptide--D-alanyl-D-alanine ligase